MMPELMMRYNRAFSSWLKTNAIVNWFGIEWANPKAVKSVYLDDSPSFLRWLRF